MNKVNHIKSVAKLQVLIHFMMFCGLINAQNVEIIESLLDSSIVFQESKPLSSLDFAFRAKMKSQEIKNLPLLSQSHYQIGKSYRILGRLFDAESHLNLAFSFPITDPLVISEYHNEMGIILKQQSRFDEALMSYKNSLVIQENINNKEGIARTYNNIGRIYEAMEDFDAALKQYIRARDIYSKLKVGKSVGITLHNIGNIYKARGELDTALQYYYLVLPIYEKCNNKLLIAYLYNSIASVVTEKNLAIEYLNKSIEIDKEINADIDLGKSYVELAGIFFKDKQFTKAIPLLKDGFDLFALGKHKIIARDALKLLCACYDSIGDYKNALKYQSYFYQYQDSIKSEGNTIAMQRYKSEIKLRDQEKEMEIQQRELSSANEKIEIGENQRILWFLGICLLLIFLTIFIFLVLSLKKNISVLNIQKRKIEQSSKEKEVLIREIHHRVKNNLQIISSLLKIEQRKTDSEEVKTVLSYSRQRIEAISFVHEKLYMQSDFTNINLEEYLSEISENLLYSSDKTDVIELNIKSDLKNINTDTAVNLGLLTAELITNSIKHGYDADIVDFKIGILVQKDKDETLYYYNDNGKGVYNSAYNETHKSFGDTLILSIIKKMNGKIINEVMSKSGYNLSFNFKTNIDE